MPDRAAFFYYLGTFALLVAAGLGLPLPEELPIVAAGAATGHVTEDTPEPVTIPPEFPMAFGFAPEAPFPANLPWPMLSDTGHQVSSIDIEPPKKTNEPSTLPSLRWWIMLPVCIIGAVTGDIFLYGIGRWGGPRLLKNRFVLRLLKPERREKIEENFHKYGVLVLVFARFLPTIRSPIFIVAGILRVPFPRFILADGLAGCFGVSLLFTLAFWFGNQFRDLVMRAEGKVDKLKPLLILLVITAIGSYLVLHFLRHPVATGDPGEELPLLGEQVAAKIEKPLEVEENKTPPADGTKPGT